SLPRTQAAQVVNASHVDHDAEVARAVTPGRADSNGNVFVTTAEGERAVGQYPDATSEEALEYVAKEDVGLGGGAGLLRRRVLGGAPGREIVSAATTLQESLPQANVAGDLKNLSATLDTLISDAEATESRQAARAQAAKLAAAEDREELVSAAEA